MLEDDGELPHWEVTMQDLGGLVWRGGGDVIHIDAHSQFPTDVVWMWFVQNLGR